MKHCTYCGARLSEDSMFCPQCGHSAPKEVAIPQPTINQEAPAIKKESTVVTVFGFVTKIVSMLAFFCLIISILDCYISASSYLSSSYWSSTYISTSAYFSPDYGWATASAVGGSAALGLSIATFIITLVKKERGERLFNSISRLVMAALLFVAAIVACTI